MPPPRERRAGALLECGFELSFMPSAPFGVESLPPMLAVEARVSQWSTSGSSIRRVWSRVANSVHSFRAQRLGYCTRRRLEVQCVIIRAILKLQLTSMRSVQPSRPKQLSVMHRLTLQTFVITKPKSSIALTFRVLSAPRTGQVAHALLSDEFGPSLSTLIRSVF
jgi:hypothetical protein